MASIIVTGSKGKLGRVVARILAEEGHEVHGIDAAPAPPSFDYTRVDLTDYGQTVDAMFGVQDRYDGVDAVVHLAAIPAPGQAADVATFDNNMLATSHVFQGALRAGIRKIVYASSETVLGLPFTIDPPYIPVDEDYDARPESNYSLVKHLEEQMAIQLCRWHQDLSITALRFSNVIYEEEYVDFPAFDSDATLRRWNLWGYIDARDGAQAVSKALAHESLGFERFVIANADTVMSRSSAELVAEQFPGVTVTKELGEHETLLSIDKARAILGYEPQHSWRHHVEG
ncbi:NAD-dependent epimerase/dehydratase family protein [Demequina zhanjiangensis]|uniref:NAD(P)-dependent oxidoreductase n=1 Tax=Demequina zhanjiangensis TaxID=3051659 RepID=A0ABT8G0F6_9MICO|nr:NAD(P)-dependent oxidoreductase [Demequina sp. SYSU T00b26]MDN4472618.1 NAD(P)-dependent oxidoreductase [Demequina sp. SYSU T00b26]